jgi:D-arabinose 1-dehydrogenase-like Zn-dependent alcohol dehydrogenase
MRAVVFKGVKQVALEDRPKPVIQDPTDIIVKVKYTALCGRYKSTSEAFPAPLLTFSSASFMSSADTSPPELDSSWAMNSPA